MKVALDKFIKPRILELAKKAFDRRKKEDPTTKDIMTIVDFTLPSDKHRFFIVNLAQDTISYSGYVSHGVNSGGKYTRHFSNVSMSKKSSLGLYKTSDTYYGKHGYSLRLDGLERGFNNRARARYIVIHSAKYVTDEFVRRHGMAGRSWGCFALDPEDSKTIINRIKDNSLLFAYFPERQWLNYSKYLR